MKTPGAHYSRHIKQDSLNGGAGSTLILICYDVPL